jgi:hypothetical protein
VWGSKRDAETSYIGVARAMPGRGSVNLTADLGC